MLPPDTAAEFTRFLITFGPIWGLGLLAVGILCWRSPQIIRELRRKRP